MDIGINEMPDSGTRRFVGDVDFNEARKRASWITPVPGGIGPMTVAMLLDSVYLSAKKRLDRDLGRNWYPFLED